MAGKGKELNPRGSVAALLGAKVRRARERKGLTQSQLAGALFTSPNRVAQIELATDPPTFKMMKQIEQVLGIDEQLEELWHLISKQPYPSWSTRFLALQGKARLIYEFGHIVPGLLQTAEYARALMEAVQVLDEFPVQERLNARMARQEVFDGDAPPWLGVVLGEAALRQQVGSKEVMRAQLEWLLEQGERRRILIQVLPFSRAEPATLNGSISIGHLPDGGRYAYTEGDHSGTLIEDAEAVDRLSFFYARLQARALDEDDTAQFIRNTLKERYS